MNSRLLDQTAKHLRDGIRTARWRGELPGVLLLAAECEVSKDSLREALRLLENEGLVSAGRAGGRRTVLSTGGVGPANGARAKKSRTLRVAILLHTALAEESTNMHQTLRDIQRHLEAAGHAVIFAAKSQAELRFAPARIARLVAATPVDAWVVTAAPRAVLEFFAAQPLPVLALGGRSLGLAMASSGVDGTPGVCAAAGRLMALGHRRLVLICERGWRQPPGRTITAFTAALAKHGITADDYHLPDFEPTPAGLRALFESLFRMTPPTALILESADYAVAAFAFLARRGLAVPRDVSLVCLYSDASLQWCDPPVAQLRHQDALVVRRVVRWCRAVARGQVDRDPVMVPAEFDEGGTIGPARK